MAPNSDQKAKLSGIGSTKTAEKDKLLEARTLRRGEREEARRVEAEKHKETGNAHFRAGEYLEAIEEYDVAIEIHGPSAAYLSNMAAAWLKLEAYDAAEHCAQRALVLDPLFMKARYRRGLARKGNLELTRAAVDFRAILSQDPDSAEAKKALSETLALMRQHDEEDEFAVSEDEYPLLCDKKVELESASDSSDWNHEGNDIPCRFYNHDGCTRGTECRFSHAPDHKSVRDRLGRNVCMYFLLGNCKFGSSACVYSHDKTYLPPGRWWEDEEKRILLRSISESVGRGQNSAFMPYMLGIVDDRLAWKSAHGVEMEEVYGHWRDQALDGFRNAIDVALASTAFESSGGSSRGTRGGRGRGRGKGRSRGGNRGERWFQDDELDSETEERMANFGFTEDDVNELLCQGVKPWDDDAWDVLDAIYSL